MKVQFMQNKGNFLGALNIMSNKWCRVVSRENSEKDIFKWSSWSAQ